MIKWLKEHKKLVLITSLIIAILIPLTIVGIIYKTNISNFIVNMLDGLGFWAIIIYIVITSIGTIILSPVPGVSMAFILAGCGLFGNGWETFVISTISVFISSLMMYILGRTGGYKLFIKIIGQNNLDKATKLIKEKGQIFFPVMMAIGGFPDDALVCVAGITKMNLGFFIPSVVIGRTIGIASIVFGIEFLSFIHTPLDWFKVIVFGIIAVIIILKLGNLINKKINNIKKAGN